ncbi:MAG: glycosyltransferase [Isosphaeraceae bacterium]
MGRHLDVVIVASQLPYPPNVGNRIRTLNLVLPLAKRHRITFIAHSNDESTEAVRFLDDHGIRTVLVNRVVPKKSGPMFYARLAANLASPLPYSVATHSSPALREAVRSFARRNRTDVWQLESTILLDAMADLPAAPKVMVAHNVESLIWQRYFELETQPIRRWYIKHQWTKFRAFERRAFAKATRLIAVSGEDARLIREDFGRDEVSVVDNGIDRSLFESVRGERDPRQILFLGALDWRPNLDAIGLLLDRIFPGVRSEEPSARLCIVGRRPSEKLIRRVKRLDGVELHADVPDVRPFLARSGVMAVPLRIGGGSRIKILEALACGLPVVASRVGAEGLDLDPGLHYIAADEADSMTRELLGCIRDPAGAQEMARRGRDFVLDRYDWSALSEKLESIWLDCAGAPQLLPQEASCP